MLLGLAVDLAGVPSLLNVHRLLKAQGGGVVREALTGDALLLQQEAAAAVVVVVSK